VKNKQKSLLDQFRESFRVAMNKSRLVDSTQEKMHMYKGEFHEYARPFDRYLEE
jgi:hypothetical protein